MISVNRNIIKSSNKLRRNTRFGVHACDNIAFVCLWVNHHIKTTLVLGPTNARSTRPILFPSVAQYATHQNSATGTIGFDYDALLPRTGCIRPPVRALFYPNFRFVGTLARIGITYPFFFLRVFTGLEMALFAGRPLFLAGCAILAAFRAGFGVFCSISGRLCAQSTKFCTIPPRKWSHWVQSFEPTLRPG